MKRAIYSNSNNTNKSFNPKRSLKQINNPVAFYNPSSNEDLEFSNLGFCQEVISGFHELDTSYIKGCDTSTFNAHCDKNRGSVFVEEIAYDEEINNPSNDGFLASSKKREIFDKKIDIISSDTTGFSTDIHDGIDYRVVECASQLNATLFTRDIGQLACAYKKNVRCVLILSLELIDFKNKYGESYLRKYIFKKLKNKKLN